MNSSVTKLRLLVSLIAASVAVLLAGCQTAPYAFPEVSAGGSTNSPLALSTASPVNASGATNRQRSLSPDRLAPGNKIVVTYSGNPNAPLKHEETVREDGYISPPLLNRPVKASDKTIGELQEELHSLYVPVLFRSLTVTVTMEDRFFFVGGEVKAPGQRPYLSEMSTLKAIQSAGDFTEFAKRSKVRIIRANGRKEMVDCYKAIGDPTKDLPIFPGDQIIVPRRLF